MECDKRVKKRLTKNSSWVFWRWRVYSTLKDILLAFLGEEFHSTIIGVALEVTMGIL
jgi:galactose-1-phosphate uridylyltransferase